MGVQRNIIRPTASELPLGESLFDSPEFVTRMMRVAQLWHYVLIGRVLAFLTFAFVPGVAGFLDHPSGWLVMAVGLPCDVVLTVIGQTMRRPRALSRDRLRLIVTQALHWSAFLLVMNMLLLTSVQRDFTATATALSIFTLLALGTFTAGVQVLSWQVCLLGLIMALGIPAIAWIENSALIIVLIVGAVVGIGAVLWWHFRGRPAQA